MCSTDWACNIHFVYSKIGIVDLHSIGFGDELGFGDGFFNVNESQVYVLPQGMKCTYTYLEGQVNQSGFSDGLTSQLLPVCENSYLAYSAGQKFCTFYGMTFLWPPCGRGGVWKYQFLNCRFLFNYPPKIDQLHNSNINCPI